jgi:ADP-ribose pyrophosphatase YjhB (NUDIX family)
VGHVRSAGIVPELAVPTAVGSFRKPNLAVTIDRVTTVASVTVARSAIRVKAMLIAPNDDLTAHTVSVNHATAENPRGFHRLIGGSVELGESHRDAIVREVKEELGATARDLTFLAALENIFRLNGEIGHEIVFLYSGRLDPVPLDADATLTEADGSVVPVVWRSLRGEDEDLPLYPTAAEVWARGLAERGSNETTN